MTRPLALLLCLAPALGAQAAVIMATVLVFVGFLFKVSAFPFHFWAPDVYEGSPTPVTTLLAVSSKAAGFGMLVRFVDGVFVDSVAGIEWGAELAASVAEPTPPA